MFTACFSFLSWSTSAVGFFAEKLEQELKTIAVDKITKPLISDKKPPGNERVLPRIPLHIYNARPAPKLDT